MDVTVCDEAGLHALRAVGQVQDSVDYCTTTVVVVLVAVAPCRLRGLVQ
jgi:hypothetical protein